MGKTGSSASAPRASGENAPLVDGTAAGDGDDFKAVAVRRRHDGWTPLRQHAFIQALGESACVAEACAAVGMSPRSAYKLRARPDASTFRQAWDVALDYAIRRLGDAALSRALHGVPRPIFYQGEQIGERRHFDEKLTMFLLRYRDPVRYGAWNDGYEARRHPDGAGIVLAHALNALLDSAHDAAAGPDPDAPPEVDCDGNRLWPAAIAAGPPAAAAASSDDYGGPEELRELFERVRALGDFHRQADLGADPAAGDWQQPLTRRRSRHRPGPDVA